MRTQPPHNPKHQQCQALSPRVQPRPPSRPTTVLAHIPKPIAPIVAHPPITNATIWGSGSSRSAVWKIGTLPHQMICVLQTMKYEEGFEQQPSISHLSSRVHDAVLLRAHNPAITCPCRCQFLRVHLTTIIGMTFNISTAAPTATQQQAFLHICVLMSVTMPAHL